MDLVISLLVGLLLGAGGTWWLREREMGWLRKELTLATDRLAHAHIDKGALIPPRPVEVKPVEPLPTEIQELVNEWESLETRERMAAKYRAQLDEGRSIMSILRDAQDGHP